MALNSTGPVIVKAEVSVNPDEVDANDTLDVTVTVSGLRTGYLVEVEPPSDLAAGLILSHAFASDNNELTIRLANVTGVAIDDTAKTWKVVQR